MAYSDDNATQPSWVLGLAELGRSWTSQEQVMNKSQQIVNCEQVMQILKKVKQVMNK